MSEVSIKIVVAGSEYPLRVEQSGVSEIEAAARLINEKVKDFETKYPVKEKKDVLAMVMLQTVTELLRQNKQISEEKNQLNSVLDELNRMVESHQEKVGR